MTDHESDSVSIYGKIIGIAFSIAVLLFSYFIHTTNQRIDDEVAMRRQLSIQHTEDMKGLVTMQIYQRDITEINKKLDLLIMKKYGQ